jgi:hypothetical protein
MSDLTPQERQRLLSIYVTQYNQTNIHITRLLDSLDDIRNNINILVGNNMNRTNQPNRTTRNNNRSNNRHQNANTNFNTNNMFNNRRPYIFYDFSNPIDRATYISDTTNNNDTNNEDITNFLTTFLNTSVPIRPTLEQLDNASRLVRYSDIQNPNSTTCAISLEPFAANDNVRQLHHCGHIFFPNQFTQWFSNSVRCPVCRHDIRTYNPLTVNTNINTDINTNSNTTNIFNPLSLDISNNELSIISSISDRLLRSLFTPSSPISTDNSSGRFLLDPSYNNVLLFDTILRNNNEQT